jgi:hypothetical protein
MAILGIAIQSKTGIPLFLDAWSEKLSAFHEGNPILIAGFLSALHTFASNYKQEISYIRFRPTEFPDDPYGIDGVYSFIGEYMVLCFTDPYQFHQMVHYKIQWIYSKVLFRYEQMIRVGKVPHISDEEHQFIESLLNDAVAGDIIYNKREQLRIAADYIMQEKFPEEVHSCFITSFDNSILFYNGMSREEIAVFLSNIGHKDSILQDGEVLYNNIALPGMDPRLVVMTNPGVKIPITDILGEFGEGSVPFYYYMITDANSSIGPIAELLTDSFNKILL